MIDEITKLIESDKLSLFRGDVGLTEGGPMVRRLEDAFCEYFNVDYAIAFNSATAALHAACVALDVRKAVVTPFSFVSSVSCVEHAGGKPIFQDISPDTYCMDVTDFENYYADAIIPVHLFGGVAEMDAIRALGVPVIEDACQAIGARYKGEFAGTMGDCGVFSFNQSKLISCGEGGMLITRNPDIALKAKLVRNHGEVVEPDMDIIGYNYRMTEIEAVIAYHRFKKLDSIIEDRQVGVDYLHSELSKIEGIKTFKFNPDIEYSWYVYPFEVEDHKKVAQGMTERGFFLRAGYITRPLNVRYGVSCPVCENVHRHIICTNIIGENKETIDRFVENLKAVI